MPRAVLKSTKDGKEHELGVSVTIIGRDESCDVVFPADQELSRKHCLIFPLDGRYFLMDYKSSNGVRVNSQRVEQCFLRTGDEIAMGEQAFAFRQLDDGKGGGGDDGDKKYQTMLDIKEDLAKETVVLLEEEKHRVEDGATPDAEADAVRKLVILYQVSKLIASELKLDELLNKVIDLCIQVCRADRGFVLLVNKEGKFQTVVSRKMEGMMASDGPIHISRSIVEETCTSKKGLLTQDAMMDKRFQTSGSVMMFNIRSAMCVPMFGRTGNLLGVIYLDNRLQSACFGEEDLQLLTAFADQAAIGIQNAMLFRQIKDETQLRNNLSRYLSPQVVEKVIREGGAGPDIGGKVVRASILFADIRGFTTFSEKQGAQKVIGFLNEYLPAMTKIIFANSGTLDKFLGDGIMAVFGAPFEVRNSAVKAIQAAVFMQHEMHNVNRARLQAGEQPLHMGIGVNSGDVISGNVGLASQEVGQSRLEFTVIGDTVNTAARLQGAAGPGEILITEETFNEAREMIEGRLRIIPRGEMTFKGKEKPVNLFKVEAPG